MEPWLERAYLGSSKEFVDSDRMPGGWDRRWFVIFGRRFKEEERRARRQARQQQQQQEKDRGEQ